MVSGGGPPSGNVQAVTTSYKVVAATCPLEAY